MDGSFGSPLFRARRRARARAAPPGPPRIRRGRAGVTLPELVVYILVAGIAAQILIAPARRQADRIALNAAREEVVALLHLARTEARVAGEALVVVSEGADPILFLSGERPPLSVALAERGIEVEVSGSRTSVELVYGPLGVAQFAPASFVLRKGELEAPIVVSGYGRVRR